MKAVLACCGALAAALLAAAPAPAQYYYPCPPAYPTRVAPDMCGSYFYCTNGYTWYGPSYNVYPPFPPVGGIQPPIMPCGSGLPSNPAVRSPRDFFMWNEAQKNRSTREIRPPFLPY